jgi:hypothetical protein
VVRRYGYSRLEVGGALYIGNIPPVPVIIDEAVLIVKEIRVDNKQN